MSIWELLLIVAGLGAAGGVVNALTSDNGFVMPKREGGILRPGFLGNILLGAVAAAIFWGLYGPYAEVNVVGEDPREQPQVAGATRDEDTEYGETLSGLIAALVVGVGGARVITSEVDKRLLRATATEAATKQPDDGAAADIATLPPAQARKIAEQMQA
jgi:hypothetical protein